MSGEELTASTSGGSEVKKWYRGFVKVGVLGLISLISIGIITGFFLSGQIGELKTVRQTIIPPSVLVTTTLIPPSVTVMSQQVPEKWYTTTTTLIQNATDAKVIIEKVIQGMVDQSKSGYINFTQSGFTVSLGEIRGKNVLVSQINPYGSFVVTVDEYVGKQDGQAWRVELTNVKVVIELKSEGRVLESLTPTLIVWVK